MEEQTIGGGEEVINEGKYAENESRGQDKRGGNTMKEKLG